MAKHRPLPSQERLQELFEYSVITGELRWKAKSSVKATRTLVGSLATNLNGSHFQTRVDGSLYMTHRLIWRLITGDDPGCLEVDHVDLCKTNNSWHNLRLATRGENQHNRPSYRSNKTGYKGVSYYQRYGKYLASIRVQGRTKTIGYFQTPEEAHTAYCKAAAELHGEFSRTH